MSAPSTVRRDRENRIGRVHDTVFGEISEAALREQEVAAGTWFFAPVAVDVESRAAVTPVAPRLLARLVSADACASGARLPLYRKPIE